MIRKPLPAGDIIEAAAWKDTRSCSRSGLAQGSRTKPQELVSSQARFNDGDLSVTYSYSAGIRKEQYGLSSTIWEKFHGCSSRTTWPRSKAPCKERQAATAVASHYAAGETGAAIWSNPCRKAGRPVQGWLSVDEQTRGGVKPSSDKARHERAFLFPAAP